MNVYLLTERKKYNFFLKSSKKVLVMLYSHSQVFLTSDDFERNSITILDIQD